jgi:hypothetical protein
MSQLGVSQIASTVLVPGNGHRPVNPSALTRESRLYSIRELARRAGVSREFFRTWTIEECADRTVIHFLPGGQKQLIFPHAPHDIWTRLLDGSFPVARFTWAAEPPQGLGAELVVPFVEPSPSPGKPLFSTVGSTSIECSVDLPLSALLTLARWEEDFISERDMHGRVPAASSLAHRERFLTRPIVDEYGIALEQAIRTLLPNWIPAPRRLRVNVSHDVDAIGLPFRLRTAVGHTIRRHDPASTLRDFAAVLPGVNPAFLEAIRRIVLLSRSRGLEPAVYWKGVRGRTRDNYDPRHPKVRAMVSWLKENQIELGVHPGYDSYRSPHRLRREVQTIREVLGLEIIGGRQDYLRWSPSSWLDWENCGLAYDSSVGFADHVGFRAGTCIPYRPWLFALNREARLLEFPLVVMDVTLSSYMKLKFRESLAAAGECIERCRAVGGVFTLLWHNDNMSHPSLDGLFPAVLDMVQGNPKYDYFNPPEDLY